jgi:hypothetical protein
VCGLGSTRFSSPNSAGRTPWTSPGRRSTAPISGRQRGSQDRTKPRRSGQDGQQTSPDHRRHRHPARRHLDRRQPQRHHPADPTAAGGTAGAGQARPPPAPPGRGAGRPRLRPRQVPPPELIPIRSFQTACGAGEILLDRRTAVRGALPLREEVVRPQRTAKGKGKEVTRSLPLSMYSAPGGLRQDPGRVAESPAEARTCGNQGFAEYVCSCRRMGLAGRRTGGGTRGAVGVLGAGDAGVRAAGLRGAAGRNATLLNGGFHD